MPYYEEWIVNSATQNRLTYQSSSILNSAGVSNVDMVRLKTYRSRPNKSPLVKKSSEVPDSMADPYTAFIGNERIKRNAASSRGFNPDLFQRDRGHPFELVRFKSEGTLWSGSWNTLPYKLQYYSGANLDIDSIGPIDVPFGFAPMVWSNLESYAATTYAKAAPAPGKFDLSQILGEAREGIPRLSSQVIEKAFSFKGLGDDYLNAVFGWKPFVQGLVATGEALVGATTAMFGPVGPIHRIRREEPSYTSDGRSGRMQITPVTYHAGYYGTTGFDVDPLSINLIREAGPTVGQPRDLANGASPLWADVTRSSRTEGERWFEGSYTFIPKIGFNPDSYLDRFEQLTAAEITPKDLYALAPWSWLIDWAVKIGDSIAANETASDNRILSNYAYAMEQVKHTRGAIFSNLTANAYAGPTSVVRQWTTTGKRRIRANPFGFKPMTAAGLNPEQWLILAALGLSKSGR